MGKKQRTDYRPVGFQSTKKESECLFILLMGLALVFGIAILAIIWEAYTQKNKTTIDTKQFINVQPKAEQIHHEEILGEYKINRRINRDFNIKYFTQGLTFVNETTLLESVGMNKRSSIHTINIDQPDQIQVLTKNKDNEFGEGCDIIDGKFYQLMWRTYDYYQYDPISLEKVGTGRVDKKLRDCWGITHRMTSNNEEEVFLTDGTENIYWANKNLKVFKTTPIKYSNGTVVKKLNELEYANGILYANIFLESFILAIDIDEGRILKVYDFSELKEQVFSTDGFQHLRRDINAVLNGIAYHEKNGTFWLTGKDWPYFWEVNLF